MYITRTMQIIRPLAGRNIVFNDRLVDGRRSVKVWSWDRSDYLKAKRRLEAAGLKVQLHEIKTPGHVQLRLHVEE